MHDIHDDGSLNLGFKPSITKPYELLIIKYQCMYFGEFGACSSLTFRQV